MVPPSVPAGALLIPVAGVEGRQLVDTFTQARSEGRIHNALDIMAPKGTPVVAAAAGRVLRLFTSERGGKTVYVLLPDGHTVHYYAHLDAYAEGLAAGKQVRAGEFIGTVGETGNVAPGSPHLHFAIWTATDSLHFWNGTSINPYPLLKNAPSVPMM
ncbi:MAG TPA: M23 family metallopeptidase [Rhodothermales bacterium]|nr:M23 family metallopeptidase [Rhodothermales bacterium]